MSNEALLGIFHALFITFLVLALVFLALTILLFFLYRIPALRAELSGKATKGTDESGEKSKKNARKSRSAVSGAIGNDTQMLKKRKAGMGFAATSAPLTSAPLARKSTALTGGFQIVKEVMMIHSDERISE